MIILRIAWSSTADRQTLDGRSGQEAPIESRALRISATASFGEGQERGGEGAIAGMRVGAILHPAVFSHSRAIGE